MKIKLPCIDCITLPICKGLKDRYKENYMEGIFITKLKLKCEIIRIFIGIHTYDGGLYKVLKFFDK